MISNIKSGIIFHYTSRKRSSDLLLIQETSGTDERIRQISTIKNE
jgi:hypothetical protein